MKLVKVLGGVLIVVAMGSAQASADLAKKHACVGCHTVDKKLVGPAFREIADKYKGQADAAGKLVSKVKTGGAGNWGQMPMPPNNIPDADAKALVAWILAGAK